MNAVSLHQLVIQRNALHEKLDPWNLVFLGDFAEMPETLSLVVVVALLGAVAAWGISESVWLSVAIAVIEVGGILFVVAMRSDVLAEKQKAAAHAAALQVLEKVKSGTSLKDAVDGTGATAARTGRFQRNQIRRRARVPNAGRQRDARSGGIEKSIQVDHVADGVPWIGFGVTGRVFGQ